jgi:thymidylate synthase (FAD)
MELVFKTSEECRVELVAHTVMKVDDSLVDADEIDADWLPVRAARASFAQDDKTGLNEEADLRLADRLARDSHLTPFEYNHATFYIEAPLFVHEQIKQHRSIHNLTMANNATSRRYTSEKIEFWRPDKWRKQSKTNKQASIQEEVYEEVWVDTDGGAEPVLLKTLPDDSYVESVGWCLQTYNEMIEMGVCREQARAVLPTSLIVRFYLGGVLRDWVKFLDLRLPWNVQEETRIVAERVKEQLEELWPNAVGVLLKHG